MVLQDSTSLIVTNRGLLSVEGGDLRATDSSAVIIEKGSIGQVLDGNVLLDNQAELSIRYNSIFRIQNGYMELRDGARVLLSDNSSLTNDDTLEGGGLSPHMAWARYRLVCHVLQVDVSSPFSLHSVSHLCGA